MKKEALAPQRTDSGGEENRKELLFNRVFDVLVRTIRQ